MAGIVLSGILASTMSTADSQLLAASSSVSHNILQEAMRKRLTPKNSMWAARVTVVFIAILGIVIARDPDSSIFGIVSFAWAGFGAGFGPLVLLSLYWKRTTFAGALAGMVSGGVMVFAWKYLVRPMGGVFGVYELGPAFVVSAIVLVAVSLMTAEPEKSITDDYEKFERELKK